jgi:hypothetical protein
MNKINNFEFNFKGKTVFFKTTTYGNNSRLAIKLESLRGNIGILTVNLPGEHLEEGEFFVKTWSENVELSKASFDTGLFINTGKRIPTGFVEAQIWKLK